MRQAFEHLETRQNVAVRFIGFSDDTPLEGRNSRIYGDHVTLSKARAQRVARAIQDQLRLPTVAVESTGLGTERPVASNATPRID